MTDDIDAVIAALEAEGSPTQIQWADRWSGWGEGTIVVRRDGEGIVATQLGRVEAEDREERFDTEAEAAAELRRRLVGRPVRHLGAKEQAEMMERARRHAAETRARLAARRTEQ